MNEAYIFPPRIIIGKCYKENEHKYLVNIPNIVTQIIFLLYQSTVDNTVTIYYFSPL